VKLDSWYDLAMAPLEKGLLVAYRELVLGRAVGRVLELGAGTGSNLAFYPSAKVRPAASEGGSDSSGEARLCLTLSDMEVSPLLSERAAAHSRSIPVAANVEDLPFPDASFETVVATLLFCSVPNPLAGYREIRRVLAPGGRYLFIEHVLSHCRTLAKAQVGLTPAWRRLAGGCRLDRDSVGAMEGAGFRTTILARSPCGLIVAGEAVVA